MTRTPDSLPGRREEESLLLIPDSVIPTENGELTYVSGSGFRFCEEGIVKSLSSMTTSSHAMLRQLIHLADHGPYEGFSSAVRVVGPKQFPTSSIWYSDSLKTSKIVEKSIVRNAQKSPTVITWKVYDVDGTTVLASVTDTITYDTTGVFELERSRIIA